MLIHKDIQSDFPHSDSDTIWVFISGVDNLPQFLRILQRDRMGCREIHSMIETNEHWFVQELSALDVFEWDMEVSEVIDYNLNFFFDEFGNAQINWLRKQLLNSWHYS